MRSLFIVLCFVFVGCGEDAPAPDKECEEAADTSWRCAVRFEGQRVRCVGGRYEVEVCEGNTWCISTSTFQDQSTYEAQCLSRSIEGSCDAQSKCPDDLVCWRERCHISCDLPYDYCLLEGQRCIGSSFGEGVTKMLCYDDAEL